VMQVWRVPDRMLRDSGVLRDSSPTNARRTAPPTPCSRARLTCAPPEVWCQCKAPVLSGPDVAKWRHRQREACGSRLTSGDELAVDMLGHGVRGSGHILLDDRLVDRGVVVVTDLVGGALQEGALPAGARGASITSSKESQPNQTSALPAGARGASKHPGELRPEGTSRCRDRWRCWPPTTLSRA